VETTATFSNDNRVCFNLTSIPDEIRFQQTKLLHFESGSWVDRTVSRDFSTLEVCADVSSFSPFLIVEERSPTAANVTVAGQVLTSNGFGVANARVTITDQNGNRRSALTSNFGYYSFEDVTVGQTYVFAVESKRYSFASAPIVLNIEDAVLNLNFVANQ